MADPQRKTRSHMPEGRVALLMVLPTLLILFTLSIYPVIFAGGMSLRIENLFNPAVAKWVGLLNYERLLSDAVFWKSLRLTLIWCVSAVAIQMVLGLIFAQILDSTMRGIGLLRSLFMIPVFISPIAMGLTWRFMFEPTAGIINYMLNSVGLPDGTWHTATDTALLTVLIADTWQWTPFVALILLAAMQGISSEILEAARLDRVRGWTHLRKIVLPLIWPVVTIVMLLRIVDSIRIFDLIWIITRGGPGTSTLLASVQDYTLFQAGRLGPMAAYGILIVILINLIVFSFVKTLYKREQVARSGRGAA